MRFKVLTPFPCAADGIHVVDLVEGQEVELSDAGTIEGLLEAGMIEAIEDEPAAKPAKGKGKKAAPATEPAETEPAEKPGADDTAES